MGNGGDNAVVPSTAFLALLVLNNERNAFGFSLCCIRLTVVALLAYINTLSDDLR